jgi:two-component system, NtrC family, sensor kinase
MIASVLIVDDSLTVRMDLAEAFEAAGYRVRPCATLTEARRALASEAPALLVLDVLLPDGDGVELLKELRASPELKELPVLMLSSEAEVRDRVRGLKTGADDYVGKPYDAGQVVARGRELISRCRGLPLETHAPILLIDDSVTFREELRRGLESVEYAVVTAATGEEGLRVAGEIRPLAIIVDGVMPGMDGATVIRKVRLDAALRGTPCLLLTGSEDLNAELRALDAGADAFVRKEEDIQVILARLGAVLRSAPSQRTDARALAGPKRILAVDDSATYLNGLAAILRDDGYDVVLAKSGEEAVEMLAAQPVDCILLDLVMPGLDGKDTCMRIKASPGVRDIPLIMLTATEERTAMVEGLRTGADDYIQKSADFEVLKARIRAQLRRKQFEDENRRIREKLLRSELAAAEARAARQIVEARAALVEELERKNKELEAFSYSVSHDLRAPLRSIDGFSQMLIEDYAEQLDETGKAHLRRVRAAAQRMGELIDDLLALSRVGTTEVRRGEADLSALARSIASELSEREPERMTTVIIGEGMVVDADVRLMRVLLENLLGNAWKFTSKTVNATIEFGVELRDGEPRYFVRDNGAGFDQTYVDKLFRPFHRLHREADFPGTGIGLATARRVLDRHGGRIGAQGSVGQGATVWFTVPPRARGHE